MTNSKNRRKESERLFREAIQAICDARQENQDFSSFLRDRVKFEGSVFKHEDEPSDDEPARDLPRDKREKKSLKPKAAERISHEVLPSLHPAR